MYAFDTIVDLVTHSGSEYINFNKINQVYNSYLRISVKGLPETTIEAIINWLDNQDWNVHPRNGDVDFLSQHYAMTNEIYQKTIKQLAALGISDYELDDPSN